MRSGWKILGGGVVMVVAAGVMVGVYWELSAPPEVEVSEAPVVTQRGRIRVEVLNAGGVLGMAGDATRTLRSAGFDVVGFGNTRTFDSERISQVIDRVGRTDVAQAVAEELGIDNVLSEPDPNLYVDVSVLLGREWAGPSGGSKGEDVVEARPWWDPRGWFGK